MDKLVDVPVVKAKAFSIGHPSVYPHGPQTPHSVAAEMGLPIQ